MKTLARFAGGTWLLVLLAAGGWVSWGAWQRAARVQFVSNTDLESALLQATSPTGYAGGKRWLIAPGNHGPSYQGIAATQRMLADAEWRIRHSDTENAPFGRRVHDSSLYRWWLGLLACCEQAISGRPLGAAVEQASLWADPLLHLLLLAGTTLFVAHQLGTWPATVTAIGLATLYPLAGGFLPGVVQDRSLLCVFGLWSVLPLVTAFLRPGRPLALYALAGIAGGLGLWISPPHSALLLTGIALGGTFSAALASSVRPTGSGSTAPEERPWHAWALSGSITCLATYLIEFAPGDLDFRLQAVHPLYGLAWLGLGEWLGLAEASFRSGKLVWNTARFLRLVLALASIASVPVAQSLSEAPSMLFGDLPDTRLANLPEGVMANDVAVWIKRDGLNGPVTATWLPLLLLVPALWLTFDRRTAVSARTAILLTMGPLMVCLVIGMSLLWWWNLTDLMLVVLLAVITPAFHQRGGAFRRWGWACFIAVVLLPGILLLFPPPSSKEREEYTQQEAEALIERSLAHWLADQVSATDAVLLTPPGRAASWCFHSGLRGLGSADLENREGLAAAVRIVSATTAEEARALLNQRGVTHIILPSWDKDLDVLTGWSGTRLEDSFIGALRRWALPPWLRPLPYQLPAVAGLENRTVAIFAVTEEENPAAAMSRTAEYFIESKQLALAESASQVLQRYPTDLGSLVAIALVAHARGDKPSFTKAFANLLANLESGSDRNLAWDRRVSLAIVLAQGDRADLAREQLRRCWDRMDEPRLRSLTTASLYRLLLLGQRFDQPKPGPQLKALCHKLLPPELLKRLK